MRRGAQAFMRVMRAHVEAAREERLREERAAGRYR